MAVKLNAAGRLDLNYGVGGIGSVTIANEHSYSQASSAVVKSDGSLFLEGALLPDTSGSGPTENLVLHFDPAGTGTASHFSMGDASPLSTYGYAITQLSSGKLLAGGATKRSDGDHRRLLEAAAFRRHARQLRLRQQRHHHPEPDG